MAKIIFILAMTLLIGQAEVAHTQTLALDSLSSTLKWTGYSEVGNYSQSGTVKPKSGTVALVNDEIKKFKIIVDMSTITHESDDLERHLKNEDFFYVEKYPMAEINYMEKKGNKLICKLTIRGKSQIIEIPVNFTKIDNGLLFSGVISIDRTKFDIKYNSSSYFQDLGSYAIKNNFELEYELIFKEI